MSVAPPREEYARRLSSAKSSVSSNELLSQKLSNTRLLVGAAAAVIAWLIFASNVLTLIWLLFPAAIFTVLLLWHERVSQRLSRARLLVTIYRAAMDRLDGSWMGKGDGGKRFEEPDHPYASDLDLFGDGSLFEMLCTARTGTGQAAIARWLQHPASPEEVVRRQDALRELRDQIELRERLALLGEQVQAGLHPKQLLAWAQAPAVSYWKHARLAAPAFVLLTCLAVLVCKLSGLPYSFALPFLLLETGFGLRMRPIVLGIAQAASQPAGDLRLLSQVMALLEEQRFQSAYLQNLRAELDNDGLPPSKQIARLHTLIDMLDSQRNAAFAFSPLLLWGTQFSFAIEAWRQHLGPKVGRWLAAVGEIEALSALAGYHYEHPGDPFAELSADGPLFDAVQAGHPLLPEAHCVRNDVRLDHETRLLLVSGSNMSGKSTLMRAVGSNAVLAFAGAPVRATTLRLSPLHIGASLRVQDSLQGGASRFYAEILKLRQVVLLTNGALPLLFLLDEILSGTNSHDRAIGAGAVVKGLVARGAIGLVTTHDLTLARIADDLAPLARNVHFADHLENGKLVFDYLMQPGVVRRSNALELMRSIGLEV